MTHRVKYVHIVCIVICVIFPSIAVIPTMAEFAHGKSSSEAVSGGLGFSVTRFPPLLCTGTSKDATFYPLILPILIILMVGMTILIIVFWIIHKVRTLLHVVDFTQAFEQREGAGYLYYLVADE